DVTLGATAIEPLSLELVRQHATVLGLAHQCVGDLDFTALAGLGLLDQLEDVRRQDVAADDGEIGRRIFRLGLLDHVTDAVDVVADHLAGDHAVLAGLLRRDFLDRDDGAAELVVQLDHLRQYRIAVEVDAQVIGQYHGERLVTDQRAAAENGVAKPFHFHLAGIGKAALVDEAADADQVFLLVGVANLVFELVADVEVVFQRTLASAGDHGNLVES